MPENQASKAEAEKKAKAAHARTRARARAKKVNVKAKSELDGFKDFIRKQGVVGLAIGLVLGVQVKAVVDQTVASFINPILGLVLPGTGSLSDKSFTLSVGAKQAVFTYGAFISVLISFITVAALIYFAVKIFRLEKLDKK